MNIDMRFGIIRSVSEGEVQEYTLDDKRCPDCHGSTAVGDDVYRRYCTNKKCNAMILESKNDDS
jgi:hypothetical protein